MKKIAFTLAELSLIFFIMAVLAVLFYRVLKPDKVVYNNLYYAAYSQMENAYREVLALPNEIGDDSSIYDEKGNINAEKFVDTFNNKIVNFIDRPGSLNGTKNDEISFANSVGNEFYQIDGYNGEVFGDRHFFSTLTNGMLIRFDQFTLNNGPEDDKLMLIATVDINGTNEPNAWNKDIIQFEINKNGIFPVGEIEANSDILKFNVSTNLKEVRDNLGTQVLITGGQRVLERNLSYETAACKANLPRHSYYTPDDCGAIRILDDCNYDKLKCSINVIKP